MRATGASQPAAAAIDGHWVASGLRTRVLLPLGIGLLLLMASLAAVIVVAGMKASEQEIGHTAASVQAMLAEEASHKARTMQSIAEFLLADPGLRSALLARDRQLLLERSLPILARIRERNGISRFYYHLPDGTNLLRVHSPHHHGDRVERQSLRQAQRMGLPSWDTEQGALGTFAVRLVQPWRIEGQLVGYLELGVEFEEVAAAVKAGLGADLYVAIDKSHLQAAQWQGAEHHSVQPVAWDEFPHDVVLSRTTPELPAVARAYLAQPQRVRGKLNVEIREGDRFMQAFMSPFELRGEQLGQLLVVEDTTWMVRERRGAVLTVIALSGIIGGSLMLFFYVLLGRVQQDVAARTARLDEARRVLEAEQQERQRAEHELLAQQERNELLEVRSRMVEELAAAKRTAEGTLRENEEITARLRDTQGQLVAAAREAGRAEIATNVLHNVGNVLNSVNVSAGVIGTTLRRSRLPGLPRALRLVQEHEGDLGDFLQRDPRGSLVPGYLGAIAEALAQEQEMMATELERLTKSIDHIKEIVCTQQSHAVAGNVIEPVRPADLAEDALRMQGTSLARHQVRVIREFQDLPPFALDRGRVLQILVNLISNAKAAMSAVADQEHRLTLRIELVPGSLLRFLVGDSGEGIPPENLTRIFSHGFTTRRGGHGFGLHSSALAAQDLGGSLTASSRGVGHGATFTLELPVGPAAG